MSLLLPESLAAHQALLSLFYPLRLHLGAIAELILRFRLILAELCNHRGLKLLLWQILVHHLVLLQRQPWRDDFQSKTLIVLSDSISETFLACLHLNQV
jgi:hypothetical protein